jgi:cytidylate kinase
MSKPSTIAIDGFAGSGKSTVGALLAHYLGYLYFDTGVMYRAVTWAVLDQQIEPGNEAEVSSLAESLTIEVKPDGPVDGRQYTVLANGRDITWEIRRPEIESYVSRIASYPRVRRALTGQQRRIATAGRVVMVGRDIGTVVLPEADLKIFMEASPTERAWRRYQEALRQNKPADLNAILAAIISRDKQDQENPVSPTVPAKDAIILNTDGLSIEAVFDRLKTLIDC